MIKARPTLADFGFEGLPPLTELLQSSQYGGLEQAVASLTVFSHPDTVLQTQGRPIFPIIRDASRRGLIDVDREIQVGFDDNTTPRDVFLWANRLRKPKEVQFIHIHAASKCVHSYTSLANIAMTPAFLAKLSDTNVRVRSMLRYRAYELYRWHPPGTKLPHQPIGYENIQWAQPLPVTTDVMDVISRAMSTKPKHRAVLIASQLGWLKTRGHEA